MKNVFESLIEKCGVNKFSVEGLAIIATFAANESTSVENIINLLLNGPEDIVFEDDKIKEIVEEEIKQQNIVITRVYVDYVSRRICVSYDYNATRFFKNKDEKYWYEGKDEADEEYKYENIIKRSGSTYIYFDKYLSF